MNITTSKSTSTTTNTAKNYNHIVTAIKQIVSTNNTVWTGTMSELMQTLTNAGVTDLPKTTSQLRVILNKVLFKVRNQRVSLSFKRTHKARLVVIKSTQK